MLPEHAENRFTKRKVTKQLKSWPEKARGDGDVRNRLLWRRVRGKEWQWNRTEKKKGEFSAFLDSRRNEVMAMKMKMTMTMTMTRIWRQTFDLRWEKVFSLPPREWGRLWMEEEEEEEEEEQQQQQQQNRKKKIKTKRMMMMGTTNVFLFFFGSVPRHAQQKTLPLLLILSLIMSLTPIAWMGIFLY